LFAECSRQLFNVDLDEVRDSAGVILRSESLMRISWHVPGPKELSPVSWCHTMAVDHRRYGCPKRKM